MKKSFLMISALIVMSGIFFIPIKTVFSFEETRTSKGQVLYIPFDVDQKAFQFIYTHSIHLSDVIEFYEVMEGRKIRSIGMEYEDLAIGMPGNAEEGQTLEIKDGKYYLTFDDVTFESFTMHLSNISSKQNFMYKGQIYELKELLEKGTSYLFTLKKISIFQWWKGRT